MLIENARDISFYDGLGIFAYTSAAEKEILKQILLAETKLLKITSLKIFNA